MVKNESFFSLFLDIKKYVLLDKNEGVLNMAVYENIFSREFSEMMNERRSQNTGFSIKDIPCPDLGLITAKDYVAGGKLAFVQGIEEPFFKDLNETNVEIVKGRVFKKRMAYFDDTGKTRFRTENNGEGMTTDVYVDKGFVAVYSPINIHLPNKIDVNGEKKNYKATQGFKYVDFVDSDKGRRYMYLIPMKYVYPMELCGLVISLNKHRAYFKGCKVALTNGHYVYVYSIPYKYRENTGYYLIGAKPSPDFDKEMNQLLEYWMKNNILFDLNMTALNSQFKGNINLGIVDIPGTCMPEEYIKIEKAMQNEELDQYDEME